MAFLGLVADRLRLDGRPRVWDIGRSLHFRVEPLTTGQRLDYLLSFGPPGRPARYGIRLTEPELSVFIADAQQLLLLTRAWFVDPNGRIPARS
jgi:hypothetical protein